jgi:hypothetical protein
MMSVSTTTSSTPRQTRHSLPTSLFCIASHLTTTWTSLWGMRVSALQLSATEYCTGTPRCRDQDGAGLGKEHRASISTCSDARVVASGSILNGRLFVVPSVDVELRPSCRIDNANKGVLSSPLRDIAHFRFNASVRLIASLRNMVAGERHGPRRPLF